jgi:hypothetical protein
MRSGWQSPRRGQYFEIRNTRRKHILDIESMKLDKHMSTHTGGTYTDSSTVPALPALAVVAVIVPPLVPSATHRLSGADNMSGFPSRESNGVEDATAVPPHQLAEVVFRLPVTYVSSSSYSESHLAFHRMPYLECSHPTSQTSLITCLF